METIIAHLGDIQVGRYQPLPEEARTIRQHVFVEEQGFQEEFDTIDEVACHLLAWYEDRPLGTARVFWHEGKGKYVLGRLAVEQVFRGLGISTLLIGEAEAYVKEQGGHLLGLSAQCRAQGLYEHLGYVAQGDVYDDEGVPHIWMEKNI